MAPVLFHLAFPVGDIATSKQFYMDGLGCKVGREHAAAAIFNLYGHQLVAHVTREPLIPQRGIYPRHFGLIFTNLADWEALRDRVTAQNISFYQAPKLRFPGLITEHHTFFLVDPFHNLLEFKFYAHAEAIFGAVDVRQIGDRNVQPSLKKIF
ncbi:MAG: VOC family protein [Cyanobacteria bacterium J06642_2]